jgi:hypothetical protein
MKTEKCEALGIKLLHIFEDDWNYHREIVKSRIMSSLNLNDRIFARTCEIRNVPHDVSKLFLETYHLQGNVNSKIRLGLYKDEKLIAIMTFGKPRFNKNYKWELLRYCSIFNTNVIGGASKLLSNFLCQYNGSIISYAARTWSNGNLYKQLGFTELSVTTPSYKYISASGMIISRFQAQKHKLSTLLGLKFLPELTELENMQQNGFYKVWDSGNRVFVLGK